MARNSENAAKNTTTTGQPYERCTAREDSNLLWAKGWMPKVAFTLLNVSAHANDRRLVLQEPVDWQPGDEIVVGRTGLGDAQQQEEMAVIESVNNTELYLRSPLRYSHTVGEGWVTGQNPPLSAVVALISRRVVVQGNVTMERMSHLRQCAKAGGSTCLYKRSERQLGSRDLGAIVVVEAFHGEASQLQVEGVQFRHVGQAFRQLCSALTVAGNAWMADTARFLFSIGDGLTMTNFKINRVGGKKPSVLILQFHTRNESLC
ncbi:hypothetical protein llap_19023 [Limosa lapponica baueri]|uniref:Uncharacterized protein n=1 Tax=Limosa lapponica baueri TaxID=1758121 RepID=A0A2I0TA43_LIMLA|nr:hypothetical protein llap_19023 [Limosa lapponica baueri]